MLSQDIINQIGDSKIASIVDNFFAGEPLSEQDGLYLFKNSPLPLLSIMALHTKKEKSADKVFYNRNFHIEPTNICVYNCKFCSYRQSASSPKAWNMSLDDVMEYAAAHYNPSMTEIHLVGGVHPSSTIESYAKVIKSLKDAYPTLSIKAFSAVEHIYVFEKANISYKDGIKMMIDSGMDSVTGGGAEIFAPDTRQQICPDKPTASQWLSLHKELHLAGKKSASTMLYGHIETAEDIINHLSQLRNLQSETGGFTTFIPLKFRNSANSMSYLSEAALPYDLRVMAISRIFLHNFDHIKAYPPALGVENCKFALMYGADDIDGTVNDTTKIYTMAGGEKLALTETLLKEIAAQMGFRGVERDTFYNEIK